MTFVPGASPYAGQCCEGVRLRVVDRNALDIAALGVELAAALNRLIPGNSSSGTVGMIGLASGPPGHQER